MELYIFPPSARVLAIVALKNHLALDCELNPIDLGRGDQLTDEYLALNPNRKMPTLARFSEIGRWYEGLAALPAWQDAVAARDAATIAWFAKGSGNAQLPGGISRDRQSA
jgi:hypothetical protein